MAGPITHIVLALKIMSLLPATIDIPAFIVGTSFPDIRYIANLSRESTHIEPVSWERVINEPNSFKAGMLFHNLVDHVRIDHFEGYFYDRNHLQHYSAIYIKLFPMVLKIAEDNMLYSMNKDWQKIMGYFDIIYDEEKALCPDEAILKKWHLGLQNYFNQPPTMRVINSFLKVTGGGMQLESSELDSEQFFLKLLQDHNFQEKLATFYFSFQTLLTQNIENKQYNFPISIVYPI